MDFGNATRALVGMRLVEADWHVRDAHRRLREQRAVVEDLHAEGSAAHCAVALLSLMILTVPIIEDLRLHIVAQLASGLA
jgi:hypothetical protein